MSKASSTSSGETKQDETQLHYLGSVLIPPAATKNDLNSTDLVRWTAIFSYLHFNEYERLSVRNLCRLFHTVLPGPTCAGVYTIFPHPNHPSLNSLLNRLNEMASVEGINVEHLFLANGVHDEGGNMVRIYTPISIIGESREHCIVIGGLDVRGKKEDDVNVSNLTLRKSKGYGVCGNDGASLHLDNVSVVNSGNRGVSVDGTKRNTMKNCNVSHSKYSGVSVRDGLVTIDGTGTTIHHNCTGGMGGEYGLHVDFFSDSIHLATCLGLIYDEIITNNGGGGNYGGDGTIVIVGNEGTIIETIQSATEYNSEDDDY
jgi:hypothetical protein